jgi:Asp-tRNA(Asn)/Glu-tRNA(Gln) amidotransferase B subunit
VPLRDSWAQAVQKQSPAAAAAHPSHPSHPGKHPLESAATAATAKEAKEAKVPEPLSAEELELLERMRPELLPIVQGVLAAHPSEVERYRGGKTGLLGFLVAQVMKQAAKGGAKANPKLVNVMLTRELGAP